MLPGRKSLLGKQGFRERRHDRFEFVATEDRNLEAPELSPGGWRIQSRRDLLVNDGIDEFDLLRHAGCLPELVAPEKRTRAFGMFYTGTIGAGALAPILYGFIGDTIGLTGGVIVVAGVVLLTLPLAFMLRPAFAEHATEL